MNEPLPVSLSGLDELCRRWDVAELSLFGSVLRDDFAPQSDVDVMVEFTSEAKWSLFDIARLMRELEAFFGRPVSLVERCALLKHHNPWLRHEILSTAQQVYAA